MIFTEIKPIAFIYNDFKEKFGIPRQPGKVSAVSEIVFEPEYRDPSALKGIEGFSHLWLVFDFSKSHKKEFSPTVRPPRLGGNKRVGVFASRSPFRPNSLGLSCVKLRGIKESGEKGTVILVEGADILNGTPIFDIKPYVPYSDCVADAKPGYTAQNCDYRLCPVLSCENTVLSEQSLKEIFEILAEDPRPSYQNDPLKVYKLRYGSVDVHFRVEDKKAIITEIKTI